MKLALDEARLAFQEEEVPVGAVIVRSGRLLGRGHNRTRSLKDPTAHAEMIAITSACETAGEERLENADLYVTLEPCSMCAGAIVLARIKRLFYATADLKTGACGSIVDLIRDPRLNHQVEVYQGLCESDASNLLSEFFTSLRQG